MVKIPPCPKCGKKPSVLFQPPIYAIWCKDCECVVSTSDSYEHGNGRDKCETRWQEWCNHIIEERKKQ